MRMGLGPSSRTRWVMSLTMSANRWPSLALTHSRRTLPGLDAIVGQHLLEQRVTPHHLVVALGVVAVTRMAAADQHPVRPVQQGLDDEGRIYPCRAHHADDPHVRRVVYAARAGKIGPGVGTPVAEEPDDLGFEAHASTPSIWAKICSSVKCRAAIALDGHAATQAPHALHKALMTLLRFFSAS